MVLGRLGSRSATFAGMMCSSCAALSAIISSLVPMNSYHMALPHTAPLQDDNAPFACPDLQIRADFKDIPSVT